jgi:hypothetical protein
MGFGYRTPAGLSKTAMAPIRLGGGLFAQLHCWSIHFSKYVKNQQIVPYGSTAAPNRSNIPQTPAAFPPSLFSTFAIARSQQGTARRNTRNPSPLSAYSLRRPSVAEAFTKTHPKPTSSFKFRDNVV